MFLCYVYVPCALHFEGTRYHNILLNRLQTSFGISGTTLNRLSSYLTGRSQFVKIGSNKSQSQPCLSGVPQGSVLGPLLFTVYISPVASIASLFGVHQQQYADDTQLYISLSKPDSAANLQVLESALSSLSAWFFHNGLALNPGKSDAILLGTNSRNHTLSHISSVNVSGSIIPLSDHIKLLGVTIDCNLNFRKHVNLVSKSSFFHIKSLRHIRHALDADTARIIGHALTSSRLDYANSVLYGSPKYSIKTLQRVQNTLARVVLQSDRSIPSTSLLQQLHWLPIDKRINFKLATLIFKAQTTHSPTYLATLLHPYIPSRSLRSSDQQLLQSHYVKTNFGSRAFRSAAPSIWNSLPLHIRSASSLNAFKSALKTFYFQAP